MAAMTPDIAMDKDTVSTFTHADAGVFAHKVIPRKSRGSVDSSSKLSAGGTTEERLSTMENSVQALLTSQQEQSQTLKDLVALLAAGTVPKPRLPRETPLSPRPVAAMSLARRHEPFGTRAEPAICPSPPKLWPNGLFFSGAEPRAASD
jgi:hypothetical protein